MIDDREIPERIRFHVLSRVIGGVYNVNAWYTADEAGKYFLAHCADWVLNIEYSLGQWT